MRGALAATLRFALVAVPALSMPAWPLTTARLAQDSASGDGLDLVAIFSDGFESQECSLWSASSNPLGAPDFDDDTFGDASQPTVYCQLPPGFVANTGDCDDSNAAVHPGALDLCNGIDDNCDGTIDEPGGDPQVGLPCDGPDGDLCPEGVFYCQSPQLLCSDQTGTTIEICNGLDDDCNGSIDDGCVYCSPVDPTTLCGASSHCTPQNNGDSICSYPAGAGQQGQVCSVLADCAEPYTCLDPGGGTRCLHWCQLPAGACSGGLSCLALVPPVFTGTIEWGVCF